MDPVDQPSPTKERVVFIDYLRGYAILMMLQGHTVDILLQDAYRDNAYWLYAFWNHMRGLTAPLFFFSAGLIFTFLLLKGEEAEDGLNPRLAKGLRRGLWLLVLGFLIQTSFAGLGRLAQGQLSGFAFLSYTHVLHTIGMTLLLIVGLFFLVRRAPFWTIPTLFGSAGFLFFALSEVIGAWRSDSFPWVLVSLFTNEEQAIFELFPWVGFGLFGAAFGWLLWKTAWYRSLRFHFALIVLSLVLAPFHNFFPGGEGFAWFRFFESFLVIGTVGVLSQVEWLPGFLARCGQETLGIYVLHVILLYGGVTGFGLAQTGLRRALEPAPTAGLALLVVLLFVLLAVSLPALRSRFPLLKWLR
ncbi:MAG: heparan-alpha-glucosaminide N-acetyltransferase domain-containing protein [Verrucomicrobiota bacterium]